MANILKPGDTSNRVPPGQYLTTKFPVLTYGPVPRFNPQTWDFRVTGEVTTPLRFNYQEFMALPRSKMVADFHCVTTWSRLDNVWEGVMVRELMKAAGIKPEARFVLILCDGGYTTNLPLKYFLDDDVMFAYRHDGQDLAPDHGFPLRLVVPKLYAWKSAKWVRGVELLAHDVRGFWEERGYHNRADPWLEERYSFQEESEE